jgi:hypothetical protein
MLLVRQASAFPDVARLPTAIAEDSGRDPQQPMPAARASVWLTFVSSRDLNTHSADL